MTNPGSLHVTDGIADVGDTAIRVQRNCRKKRKVYLPLPILKEVRKQSRGQTYLFEHHSEHERFNIARSIRELGLWLRNRGISALTLRHSLVTFMVPSRGLEATSRYIGHARTAITDDLYQHDAMAPVDLAVPLGAA